MTDVNKIYKVMEFDRKIVSIQLEGRTILSDEGEICCYKEHGEGGYVPWFLVTNKAGISERINGRFVISIRYE